MQQENWIDNFITFEDGEYTVWDETQAYTVGVTKYYNCAVAMLYAYVELLEKEYENND